MQYADVLALAGLRIDGRKDQEIRNVAHKLNIYPQSDGSCYYEQVMLKLNMKILI